MRSTGKRGITTCVVIGCQNRTSPSREHPKKPPNVCYDCWRDQHNPTVVLGSHDSPIAVGTLRTIGRIVSLEALAEKGVTISLKEIRHEQ